MVLVANLLVVVPFVVILGSLALVRGYADLIPLISPLYWFIYMHTLRGSVVSLMRDFDYITDKLTHQKKLKIKLRVNT